MDKQEKSMAVAMYKVKQRINHLPDNSDIEEVRKHLK